MALPSSPHGGGATEKAAAGTAASGAIGTATALLPHLLHHAGLIAGAAFLSGLAGGVAGAALGLVAIAPIAWRLRGRTGSWRAALVAVSAFGVMFLVMTGFTRGM